MNKMNVLAMVLSLNFLGFGASAALHAKPGLWQIQTSVIEGNKKTNPQAEMQKAMAKMSPEQRKQMQAMMGKMGVGADEKGLKVCLTKEMMDHEELLAQRGQNVECDRTYKTQTDKKIVLDFKCKDGSNGTVNVSLTDDNHFTSHVVSNNAKGVKSEVDSSGAFLSADCGNVKPIALPKK